MMDRRRREEPDPFLDWKVRIFFGGAMLLVAGVFLERDVLALIAAVVLAAGAVLMGIDRYRRRRLEAARIAHYDRTDTDFDEAHEEPRG
jgi:hypothetical protein